MATPPKLLRFTGATGLTTRRRWFAGDTRPQGGRAGKFGGRWVDTLPTCKEAKALTKRDDYFAAITTQRWKTKNLRVQRLHQLPEPPRGNGRAQIEFRRLRQ